MYNSSAQKIWSLPTKYIPYWRYLTFARNAITLHPRPRRLTSQSAELLEIDPKFCRIAFRRKFIYQCPVHLCATNVFTIIFFFINQYTSQIWYMNMLPDLFTMLSKSERGMLLHIVFVCNITQAWKWRIKILSSVNFLNVISGITKNIYTYFSQFYRIAVINVHRFENLSQCSET